MGLLGVALLPRIPRCYQKYFGKPGPESVCQNRPLAEEVRVKSARHLDQSGLKEYAEMQQLVLCSEYWLLCYHH